MHVFMQCSNSLQSPSYVLALPSPLGEKKKKIWSLMSRICTLDHWRETSKQVMTDWWGQCKDRTAEFLPCVIYSNCFEYTGPFQPFNMVLFDEVCVECQVLQSLFALNYHWFPPFRCAAFSLVKFCFYICNLHVKLRHIPVCGICWLLQGRKHY